MKAANMTRLLRTHGEDVTVIRRVSGSRSNDGTWVPGEPTPETVRCVSEPGDVYRSSRR